MSSESTEQEAFPTIPVKRIAKRDEIDLLDYLFHDIRIHTTDGHDVYGYGQTYFIADEIDSDEDELGLLLPGKARAIVGVVLDDIDYIECLDDEVIDERE